MTDITLKSADLSATGGAPGVDQAIRELGHATRRLAVALWAAGTQRPVFVPRVLTAAEEAAELREFAALHMKTDPGFAADLFAAADRHELTCRE